MIVSYDYLAKKPTSEIRLQPEEDAVLGPFKALNGIFRARRLALQKKSACDEVVRQAIEQMQQDRSVLIPPSYPKLVEREISGCGLEVEGELRSAQDEHTVRVHCRENCYLRLISHEDPAEAIIKQLQETVAEAYQARR
jgi:hypothetical protein